MLSHSLIHPQILYTLGQSGHGSQILIADGNYPFKTTKGPNSEIVNLNLSPGIVNATQVLTAILTATPIEAASIMAPEKHGPYALNEPPAIWSEFERILKANGFVQPITEMERMEFYNASASPNVALIIATGEQRIYANILLTIGVIQA